jgi:hypothetical protein
MTLYQSVNGPFRIHDFSKKKVFSIVVSGDIVSVIW